MVRSATLPAAICADCGHGALEHRTRQEPEIRCSGAGDLPCPCTRSREVVEHSAAVLLAERTIERRRLGYAITVSTLACVLAGGGSFGLSAHNTRQSERKLCEVIALSRSNAERQVAAYDREPPRTPAGQEQAEQVRIGLDAVLRLERSLRCPKGSPR